MIIYDVCLNCGFIKTFEEGKNKAGYPSNEFNIEIRNLDGINLKIFDEIKFNGNYAKWEIVIMLSRLLIMNLAINKLKEKRSLNFQDSLDFLEKQKMLNPKLHNALDKIKKIENNVNQDYQLFKKEKKSFVKKQARLCFEVVVDVLNNFYKYKHFDKK